MADPHRSADAGTTDHAAPGADPPAGPPRWVRVFGIVALVVLVLIVALLVFGGGGAHGPGRHASSSATTPVAIAEASRATGEPSATEASLVSAPDHERR